MTKTETAKASGIDGLTCPTCRTFAPKIRADAAGKIVESCTEPTHAAYAKNADAEYRAVFSAKRQAELDAERRAPKSKAIKNIYFELTEAEYNEALRAVGLSREETASR